MSYSNRQKMPVQLQIVLWVVGFVAFMFVMVIGSDVIMKDRYCFEAGGRIVDNVCMPVNGAINLQDADQKAGR